MLCFCNYKITLKKSKKIQKRITPNEFHCTKRIPYTNQVPNYYVVFLLSVFNNCLGFQERREEDYEVI